MTHFASQDNSLHFSKYDTFPLFAISNLTPATTDHRHVVSLLLSSLLTPWSRVLLEELTGLQLVGNFPEFYVTGRQITAFTIPQHLSLSSASTIQSIPPHPTSWRSILILSFPSCLGLPSGLFPSGFPTRTLYTPQLLHPSNNGVYGRNNLPNRPSSLPPYRSLSLSLSLPPTSGKAWVAQSMWQKFSSPERPDRNQRPRGVIFSGYRRLIPWGKAVGLWSWSTVFTYCSG